MKNKQQKPTVTIGIPAYNEEANIACLIGTILRQRSEKYTLEKIIVLSDGSTDKTEKIVKDLAKLDRKVTLHATKKRCGKTTQLNTLYRIFTSDFLLTLDADVGFAGISDIDHMIEIMTNHPKLSVLSAKQIPVNSVDSFIGQMLYINYLLWNKVKAGLPNDSIYHLTGSSALIRNKFAKKIVYPTTITNDQSYLYMMANAKKGFMVTDRAAILQHPVSTIADLRLSHSRSNSEREDIERTFDIDTTSLYTIPTMVKCKAALSMFFIAPVHTIAAIIANYYVKFFPYTDSLHKKGLWEIVTSTKKEIAI